MNQSVPILLACLLALVGMVVNQLSKIRRVLDRTPRVLVNGKSERLYSEIFRGEEYPGLVSSMTQAPIRFLERAIGSKISNCKVQSMKIFGMPSAPDLSLYGVTFQLHVSGEVRADSNAKEFTRVSCNFIVNTKNKVADIIWLD